MELGDVKLSQQANQSTANVSFDLSSIDASRRVGRFGGSGLSVSLESIDVDFLQPGLGVAASANWDQSQYTLGIDMGLSPVSLDGFSLAWKDLAASSFTNARKLPIGGTGFVMVHNNTSLEWSRADASIKGSVKGYLSDVGGGVAAVGFALRKHLLTGSLGIEISNQARTWSGSGNAVILETFSFASTQLTAGLLPSGQYGLELKGNINIADAVKGNAILNGQSGSRFTQFYAQSQLNLQVPDRVRILGGLNIAGVDSSIMLRSDHLQNNELTVYVQSRIALGLFTGGLRVDFSDPSDIDFVLLNSLSDARNTQRRLMANQLLISEHSFTVNSDQTSVIFNAVSDNGMADMELVLPNGDVVTAADHKVEPQQTGLELLELFYIENGTNQGFFVVNTPQVGDYLVRVNNDTDLTNLNVKMILSEPEIQATTVLGQEVANAGDDIAVSLDLDHLTGSAEAQLALISNTTGVATLLDIATVIMGSNELTLTLPDDLTPDTYQLEVVINDEVTAKTITAATSMTVANAAATAQPTAIVTNFANGAVDVSWQHEDVSSVSDYIVLVKNLTRHTTKVVVVSGDQQSELIGGLVNGDNYSIALAALNEDELASGYTEAVSGSPQGDFNGGTPDLSFVAESGSISSDTEVLGEPITVAATLVNSGKFDSYSARVKCYYDSISSDNLVSSSLLGNIAANQTIEIACSIDQSLFEGVGSTIYFSISDVSLPEDNTANNTLVIDNPYMKHVAPIATIDAVTIDEDTTVTIDVLDNDYSPSGKTIQLASIGEPSFATVTQQDNSIIYQPNANYFGNDSFTYLVTDGELTSGSGMVTMTINPVNDAPIVEINTEISVSEAQQGELVVQATDIDSENLTYEWIQTSGPNMVLSDPNSSSTTFTAPYVIEEQLVVFTVTVSDGDADVQNEVRVSISNDNQPPVVTVQAPESVNEGDVVTMTVNAQDPEGGNLSYVWQQTAGDSVTLSSDSDASITFTAPNVSANTSISFDVTVSDAELSIKEVVTITVNNVEQAEPPAAGSDSSGGSFGQWLLLMLLPVGLRRL